MRIISLVGIGLAAILLSGCKGGGGYGYAPSASTGAVNRADISALVSQLEGAEIVANDGTFLGIVSSNKYDSKSILNKYGDYGSSYSSKSIFNKYGSYGSSYSSSSAFNPYATDPPMLVLRGNEVAYLTTNTTKSPRISPVTLLGVLAAE